MSKYTYIIGVLVSVLFILLFGGLIIFVPKITSVIIYLIAGLKIADWLSELILFLGGNDNNHYKYDKEDE